MKKSRMLLLVFVMLILTSAVTVGAIEAAQRRNANQADNDERDNFVSVIEANKATNKNKSLDKVPVYVESELLFNTDGLFYLSRDACFYEGQNARQNYTGSLLEAYPTTAIRSRDRDTVYFVYMTDTGYRLYLFASYDNGLQTPVGFPVVVEKLLSYENFSSIKIGDRIEAVEKIDSVASLQKKQILEVWDLGPIAANKLAEDGYPCTTIHYLKDGILKIEYEMLDDRSLIVSDIMFSKEFLIESANGNVVNYKIEDVDLPTS